MTTPPFNSARNWEPPEAAEANDVRRESSPSDSLYQKMYQGVLASIPSSILLVDRARCVVSANRNFLIKGRRSEGNTIGARIQEVFSPVLLNYTGLDEKIRSVFRTGQAVDGGKMTYRAPGLPQRIYFYRLTPIAGDDGATEYVMVLMDDITEQERLSEEVRRAERHLASIVETASDLVISLDLKERILSWNHAAEQISGLRVSEVLHRPLSDLCSSESREGIQLIVAQLAQGSAPLTQEADLMTKEGRMVPVAWAFSSMRDTGGGMTAIVVVGRDLTLRRQLEAQLLQSAKMASLGVMAGGIAHEIRNPLGICSAAAQLMLESPDDRDLQQQCAQLIFNGIKRASFVIENLLKFARPPEKQLRPLDINDATEEALSLVANQARTRQIQVELDLAPDLLKLEGNSNLLQQVFANLMLNAFNAMPDGGVLSIRSRLDGDTIVISFSDTGCGIPPEDRDKIFDPFFTTMPAGQGTGLGLPISYSIVSQHGGTISVRSQVNAGSTFTVCLPLKNPRN